MVRSSEDAVYDLRAYSGPEIVECGMMDIYTLNEQHIGDIA